MRLAKSVVEIISGFSLLLIVHKTCNPCTDLYRQDYPHGALDMNASPGALAQATEPTPASPQSPVGSAAGLPGPVRKQKQKAAPRKPTQNVQKSPPKGSVKSRKPRSGTGYGLAVIPGVDWEQNKRGGFEAWKVPPGVTHRRGKKYLGYAGKRLVESWARLGADERQNIIGEWIATKRREKGIAKE